jgi:phosphoglycolate phosphatase-like HAD superfamily hydrolase
MIDWFGRTDYDICASALEMAGYKGDITKIIPDIFESFIIHFKEYANSHKNMIRPIPFAAGLLEKLSGSCIGLLTGNIRETAFIKLEIAGFGKFFPYGVGGFGSDSRDRRKLFKPAVERMKKHYGTGTFDRVIIIGDSPRDIDCAKENGAFSIAVATGRMKYDELALYSPDLIIENLKDIAKLKKVLTLTPLPG